MRDVRSEPLYIQMKGRGTRTVSDDILRDVTPNAYSKDCFYLVDAVGVTESEKVVPIYGEDDGPHETLTLKQLLERMTHGQLPDGYFKLLASRLARISSKCTEAQRKEFTDKTHGISMHILTSMNPILNVRGYSLRWQTILRRVNTFLFSMPALLRQSFPVMTL